MPDLPGFHHLASAILVCLGFHAVLSKSHLVKKLIGLGVLQTGVFLFFISAAARDGATAPIIEEGATYAAPLPHVLILTAIVVGVSVTAVGLALAVRIQAEYGTCEIDDIHSAEER
ncbi:MAG: cation:proton antiporter subunit C [Acidobacteriota bacterium]